MLHCRIWRQLEALYRLLCRIEPEWDYGERGYIVADVRVPGLGAGVVIYEAAGYDLVLRGVSGEELPRDEEYVPAERIDSPFYRLIRLPVPVGAQEGTAEPRNGYVKIRLQRLAKSKPEPTPAPAPAPAPPPAPAPAVGADRPVSAAPGVEAIADALRPVTEAREAIRTALDAARALAKRHPNSSSEQTRVTELEEFLRRLNTNVENNLVPESGTTQSWVVSIDRWIGGLPAPEGRGDTTNINTIRSQLNRAKEALNRPATGQPT
jgi:hypothetical protein